MKTLYFLLLSLPVVQAASSCPFGWFQTRNINKCYLFTHNTATSTWSTARVRCQASGGDLVSIHSKQEWNYLVQTMRRLYHGSHNVYSHWWIGLNKAHSAGYTWSDGTPVNKAVLTWKSHAAVNDTRRRCALFNMFQLDVGLCFGNAYQSICSRPKGSPLLCDTRNHWQHYNGKCYRYVNAARTWSDASRQCRTYGATLPIIYNSVDQQVNAQFAREAHTSLWTALQAKGSVHHIQWVWQNGHQYTQRLYFSNYKQPQNITHPGDTCVELSPYLRFPATWHINTCHAKRKFYCQRALGQCANGWLQHGPMCYQFNPHQRLSWSKSNAYCKAQGGNLVSITSGNIQTFLNPYLATQNRAHVPTIWLGLTDNNKDSGGWTWSTGTRLGSYHNFIHPNPRNTHGHQDCFYIYSSDSRGRWHVTSDCTSVRSFICQIKTNTTVKPVTPKPATVHYTCPRRWIKYGMNCYFLNERDMAWDKARTWCQQSQTNGDLVRIQNSRVQSFLSRTVKHGNYWIGLNRRNSPAWVWMTDTIKTNYTYWTRGQPGNRGGHLNCARILAGSGPRVSGHWASDDCGRNYNSICQTPVGTTGSTVTTPTPTTWTDKCGPFWTSDPNSANCYVFSEEMLTWYDAQSTCKSRGGQLASIVTREESFYLEGHLQSMQSVDYWIGANDIGSENGWKWNDHSPFGYLNWSPGEPDDDHHNADCAAIYSTTGRWHDTNCNLRKGFICKKSTYYTCSNNWLNYKSSCLYMNHQQKATWQGARQWCKRQHGDLVRINSKDMLTFVDNHIDKRIAWWIGINDIKHEHKFVWLDDNSTSGYMRWNPGEPNNVHNEDCGLIARSTGYYNDARCSRSFNFICQTAARKVSSTPMPQTTQPNVIPSQSMYGCPLNWRGFRGSCYMFLFNPGTWENSVTRCGNVGAKITSIIDRAENKFVFSMIPKRFPSKVWIGLNDKSVEMKFEWFDNVPISYTYWAKGQPDNWQGHEQDCVAMDTRSAWWDQSCSAPLRGTVCKRPKAVIPIRQKAIGQGCRPKNIGYHATCYSFVYSPTKSWMAAEQTCVARYKGHLATVTDSQVQAFLGAEMLHKPAPFWVGLSDRNSPGAYQWNSHAQLTYTAWYETHTGNERSTCVALRASRPSGLWENHNCNDHRPYICEYPRTGFTTLPTSPPTKPSALPCPTGWTSNNVLCYKYFGDNTTNLMSWTEARAACRGYGGDLVSIHNSTLETFFQKTLLANRSSSYWIGLNDRDIEDGYTWTDGSQFGYSNWANGEPNNLNNQEDCVEYNRETNTWNDANCFLSKFYICQLKKGINITTTPAPPTGSTSPLCPSQGNNNTWYLYNNNCYMRSPLTGPDSLKTWYRARFYCKTLGAELASVHSTDENGFLTTLSSKSLGSTNRLWLGLNSLDRSGFQWSDGSGLQFLLWQTHQPDDGDGAKRCGYISNVFGSWFLENCNDIMGFICKKHTQGYSTVPSATPTSRPLGCATGFSTTPYSSLCYKLVQTNAVNSKNWNDANAACKSLYPGSTLAVIRTVFDHKYMLTLLKNVMNANIWIGLKDMKSNGRFMWTDSSEVHHTDWAPGQPNEVVSNDKVLHQQQCVMMWTRYSGPYQPGTWDDRSCQQTKPYACSMPKSNAYPSPAPSTQGCTKQGYIRWRNACYKLYKKHKTWSKAQDYCASEGANLVSVADIYEVSFLDLLTLGNGQTWLGLSASVGGKNFAWSDGLPVTFTRWGQGEPSSAFKRWAQWVSPAPGGPASCVSDTFNWQWNTTYCKIKFYYVCKYYPNGMPTTTPVINGLCPDSSWSAGTDYCYKLMSGVPMSWPEARYMCQKTGADLVSIASPTEMTFVKKLVVNETTDVWTGLSRGPDGGFAWSDRLATSYTNWATNEPSDKANLFGQDCVLMMAYSNLQWNDVDCLTKIDFVCKILKRGTSTSAAGKKTSYTKGAGSISTYRTNTPAQGGYTPASHTNAPGRASVSSGGQNTVTPSLSSGRHNTATPTPAPVNQQPGNSALSNGAVAGITIAVVLVIVAVALTVVFMKRKNIILTSPAWGFENAIYDKHKDEVQVSSSDCHSENADC